MTAVGSPAWVARTRGSLRVRDQLRLGLAPDHRPGPEVGCFAVHGAVEAQAIVLGAGAAADFGARVADAIGRARFLAGVEVIG